MQQDLTITNNYINLAAAVILQSYKDIEQWKREEPIRIARHTNRLCHGYYVTINDVISAEQFLSSEYAQYLKVMVIDWHRLRNEYLKGLE